MLLVFGVVAVVSGGLLLGSHALDPLDPMSLNLTTSDDSVVTAVEKFGADIGCSVTTCTDQEHTVLWYHEGELISIGTKAIGGNQTAAVKKYQIDHNVALNPVKDCVTNCHGGVTCPLGQHCLSQSQCCFCDREDYTLEIRDVNLADSGIYRCMINNTDTFLEFNLHVFESGLPDGFHQNFTYDHSQCCEDKGVSKNCLAPCKIQELHKHVYNPLDCEDDLGKTLQCVTEGGNVSHVHCCRLQLIPPFCWDFCTGNLETLLPTHRLCFYWLPEILECYEQAYLPFPSQPIDLTISRNGSNALSACWSPPENPNGVIQKYTVHFKEVPSFSFFGSGVPLSSHPNGFEPDTEEGPDIMPPLPPSPPPPSSLDLRRKREAHESDFYNMKVLRRDDVTDMEGTYVDGSLHYRRKRQTWIFVAHNKKLNETQRIVKEYKFKQIDTKKTCQVLSQLNSGTQYFIYVTATNEFGASLPSTRALAVTEDEKLDPTTVKRIKTCCRTSNVTDACMADLCDVGNPPSIFSALQLGIRCPKDILRASHCLADKRDHTPCCRDKGVNPSCMSLCSASADDQKYFPDDHDEDSFHESVMCMGVDAQSIYSCLKIGYATHPAPPSLVTVSEVGQFSVKMTWQLPEHNAHHAKNYTLFYRMDDYRNPWIEVHNVESPFILENLVPDSPYMAYLVSKGELGNSGRSTMLEFFTKDRFNSPCSIGRPLLVGNTDAIYACNADRPCPRQPGNEYECVAGVAGAEEVQHCCLKPPIPEPPMPPPPPKSDHNLTKCCEDERMPPTCVTNLCHYRVTAADLLMHGTECFPSLRNWVRCAGDQRDHTPCCMQTGVPADCQIFCRPPQRIALSENHVQCIVYVEAMMRCAEEGVGILPGPPLFVQEHARASDSVTFRWMAPRQTTTVTKYEVVLGLHGVNFANMSAAASLSMFNTTDLKFTLRYPDNFKYGTKYQLAVVSLNDHGRSIFSNMVKFAVRDPATVINHMDDKPTAVYDLRVQWQKGVVVNITWDWNAQSVNGKNLTNYYFIVHHDYSEGVASRFAGTRYHQATTTKHWVVLQKLVPSVQYEVFVVAMNNGTTPPLPGFESSIITVVAVAAEEVMSVKVVIDPPVVLQGEKATVTCALAEAVQNVTVSILKSPGLSHIPTNHPASVSFRNRLRQWRRRKGPPLATGTGLVTYVIPAVNYTENLDMYMCEGHREDIGTVYSQTALFVKFRPVVKLVTKDHQTIDKDTETRLICSVIANPLQRSQLKFHVKNGQQWDRLRGDVINERYGQYLDIGRKIMDRVRFSWKIPSVAISDQGEYECEACNELGCTSQTMTLKVSEDDPCSKQSTRTCCKNSMVPENCLGACGQKINLDVLLNENNTDCQKYFPQMATCLVGEVDFTPCCITAHVPTPCLPICDGSNKMAPSHEQFMPCTAQLHIGQILECIEHRHRINIEPPRDLKVTGIPKGGNKIAVQLKWTKSDSDFVTQYVVAYEDASGGERRVVRTNKLSYTFGESDLHPSIPYWIVVAAEFCDHRSAELSKTIIPDQLAGMTSDSHRSSGVGKRSSIIVAIVVCILVMILAILAIICFLRRPNSWTRKMPAIFTRGAPTNSAFMNTANESVSFENPGYANDEASDIAPDDQEPRREEFGWQTASLESPVHEDEAARQHGMKYAQLT